MGARYPGKLALNGGINAVSQQPLGIVAPGAGIGERDEGILADREQLLLGVKVLGVAPELRSGLGDKHEEGRHCRIACSLFRPASDAESSCQS